MLTYLNAQWVEVEVGGAVTVVATGGGGQLSSYGIVV